MRRARVPALLVLMLSAGAAMAGQAVDPNLVGDWSLHGQPFVTFKADGSGTMEGDPFRWTADGRHLTISDQDGTERHPYQIKGGHLSVTMEGGLLLLERMGRGSAKAEDPKGKPSPGAKADRPGQDQLAQLLLSSAWCSFSYNKVSGASHSSRAQFFPDGTWSASARGETYSSGPAGSVAGQHDSGGRGQWKVEQGRLFMSNPPEAPALAPVDLTVARNSSGYPILTADGTEYSQCR